MLDLLTGHTLYNDSAVVLRELAQNAIDAVRLQAFEDRADARAGGHVLIRWNSEKDELEIADNGTGMTQEVIEKHLLKVGSSRYQDDKFKESHPAFSPISRFGIGVLSAFMIADEVEFLTCSPTEESARQISLRSVHGKYLIRLMPKDDEMVRRLAPHGTCVRLKLRPSARRIDVLHTARQWVLVPGCAVEVQVDSESPVRIGFASPKEVLESYLAQSSDRNSSRKYRIEEKTIGGLSVAYGLVYNDYLDEWTFLAAPSERIAPDGTPVAAMCVEGVAVEFRAPGFDEGGILALANATGQEAPKTNVARSSLEETEEKTKVIEKTYAIYVAQLHDEVKRMLQKKYPLSRIINQLPFIADELDWNMRQSTYTADRWEVSHPQALRKSFSDLPLFLLEDAGGRVGASLNDLIKRGGFWTVESALTSSLENLISHMPVDVTARNVLSFAKDKIPELPEGALISNLNSKFAKASIDGIFEIIRIRGIEEGHRLEIQWGASIGGWISSADVEARMERLDYRESVAIYEAFQRGRALRTHRNSNHEFKIPVKPLDVEGLGGASAVSALGTLHFLPGKLCIERYVGDLTSGDFDRLASAYVSIQVTIQSLDQWKQSNAGVDSYLDKTRRNLVSLGLDRYLQIDHLKETLAGPGLGTFNPFAWSRSGDGSSLYEI